MALLRCRRERENCVGRDRVIDDDLVGLVMNGRKWTVMMTNEHHLVLMRGAGRKWNNR
jgi:hypothetical protein